VFHKTDEAEAYEWLVADACADLPAPRPGALGLVIDFYFRDARSDIDGRLKLLIDAIAAALKFNDKFVAKLHVEKHVDAKRPRAEVALYQFGVSGVRSSD
jgi:Holliday junction resolvase RusA-like endonuclease